MLRQDDIARRCRLQDVEEASKVLRHLEEPDGMTHRRSVDHDLVVIAVEEIVNRQQRRNFGHAGKAGIEQWREFVACEQAAFVEQHENVFTLARQKFLDLAIGINLPRPALTRAGQAFDAIGELQLQHIRKGMRRIGGQQQHTLSLVARGVI